MRRWRQVLGRSPARGAVPEGEGLALKDESLIERPDDLFGPAKVLVIAGAFPGEKSLNRVMEVITPQAIKAITTLRWGENQLGIIAIGLGDHRDVTAQFFGQGRHVALELSQDVRR